MGKQKIQIFENESRVELEEKVSKWLNDENNKNIKIISISASNKNQYGGYIIVIHYEYIDTFMTSLKNLKKITIKEFKENSYSKKLCIHCDTEEKAQTLCNYIKYFGTSNHWNIYKEATCYSFYGYASINYYKNNEYTIYEFDDVIFE